jgi:Mycotoxin biosynthesis protein UstYa
MLRQASMCHVDTSLTTFVWDETTPKPMFNVHMAPRTCVNFDQLVASTQDRWVDVQEIEELQNPLMSGKK